jgi:threonyl-tRNA synthetase
MDRALAALEQAGIQKCHIFVYGENQDGLLFWEKTGWAMRDELVILSKDI